MPPANVTVTVDPTTSYQTMVGFGAAVAYYDGSAMANAMSAQLFQTLFGDLGIQVLRVGNWYQNDQPTASAPSIRPPPSCRRSISRDTRRSC